MNRWAFLLFFVYGLVAKAGPINVGFLSFDNLQAGINVFTLYNGTGTAPCSGPCALSDFPVSTSLSFGNVSLQILVGGSTQTKTLSASLGPGTFQPVEFQFPATTLISSATLTATIDRTNISLIR